MKNDILKITVGDVFNLLVLSHANGPIIFTQKDIEVIPKNLFFDCENLKVTIPHNPINDIEEITYTSNSCGGVLNNVSITLKKVSEGVYELDPSARIFRFLKENVKIFIEFPNKPQEKSGVVIHIYDPYAHENEF